MNEPIDLPATKTMRTEEVGNEFQRRPDGDSFEEYDFQHRTAKLLQTSAQKVQPVK